MRIELSFSAIIAVAAGTSLGIAAPAEAGPPPQDVFWDMTVDGDWGDFTRWTEMVVPNNMGANRFNAFIRVDDPGVSPYTVSLDIPITINNLTIDSAEGEATVSLGSNNLVIEGDLTVTNNNQILGAGAGGGETTANGMTSFTYARIWNIPRFRQNGPVRFTGGGSGEDICDTDFEHSTDCSWEGPADLFIGGTSTFTTLTGATLTIASDRAVRNNMLGGGAQIVNSGTIIKNAGTGTMIEDIGVVNNAGAMLEVAAGAITITGAEALFTNDGMVRIASARRLEVTGGADFTNFNAGALTGGIYDLSGRLQFDAGGAGGLTTIDADVTLDGAGAEIVDTTGAADLVPGINTIAATGELKLLNGRDVTTAGDFDNNGLVRIDTATTLTIDPASDLNGFTASGTGTLTGGEFEVLGTLRFDAGALGIRNIDTTLVLDGSAAMIENSDGGGPADALAPAERISNNGVFELRGGRDFTTAASFTVEPTGSLVVELDSVFEVPNVGANRLINFDNNILVDGSFEIRGELAAPNLEIGTLGATGQPVNVTLDGPQSVFRNNATNTDAFAALATIETGSSLSLLNGRSLTVLQDLTVRGTLNIGGTGGRGAQSSLTVDGDYIQDSGALELINGALNLGGSYMLNGGTIAGTGMIDVSITERTSQRGAMGDAVYSAGNLAPGSIDDSDPIGSLTIIGDYVQSGESRITVQLGGLVAGVTHDQVIIEGTAMIGADSGRGTMNLGELHVSLLPGYQPELGDEFSVLVFASRIGDFETVFLPQLGGGLRFEYHIRDGEAVCIVVPAPGAGAAGIALIGLGVAGGRRRRCA